MLEHLLVKARVGLCSFSSHINQLSVFLIGLWTPIEFKVIQVSDSKLRSEGLILTVGRGYTALVKTPRTVH